jgi:hypothetical protein
MIPPLAYISFRHYYGGVINIVLIQSVIVLMAAYAHVRKNIKKNTHNLLKIPIPKKVRTIQNTLIIN